MKGMDHEKGNAITDPGIDHPGKIVLRHSDVMGKEFTKGDSYKTGAYHCHENG
jgi:hypothetical protein